VFARARDGSEIDLRTLIDEYGDYIRRVVRHRLDARLRSKFDSLDFVQMVCKSFFSDPGGFDRFESPDRLIAYLAGMARHKVADEQRRRTRRRNGTDREQPMAENLSLLPPANETTPSHHAMAREAYEFFEATESERDREIMRLRCEGLTYDEVARRTGLHERTVRRIVERLLTTHSQD